MSEVKCISLIYFVYLSSVSSICFMMNSKNNRLFTVYMVFFFVLISCEKNEVLSGVEGTVFRGPINPVAQEGEINDLPFSALFHVYNKSNIFVKSFNSNEKGEFNVELESGIYVIIPDESAPILRPDLQVKEVIIQHDYITQKDLYFDTGIR